nr:retrovirus-related Pol polyprotein from transposon TNT 1-94 [Tanacetum cinerariifolium]
MPKMELNSKFVNNMLLEWGRFVTVVKLNRGLKESNYEQLYSYLKQHEVNANKNKMMLERCTQHRVDPFALMSTVSPRQYFSQSSTTPPSTHAPQVDECDAFDSDVDEAPTTQTMFMANLLSADPVYDEADPSYESNIISEYVKDNAEPVVQNNVSSIPNDASMIISNEMHKQTAQCVSVKVHTKVVEASLTAKLAIYREQVKLRPLLDDYKKGKKINNLQLIMCGDMFKDSNSYLESKGSIKDFVSFREMITS